MKLTPLIAVTLLSLAIWAFFYFVSMPLKGKDIPVIVIFSAIIVYSTRFLYKRIFRKKEDEK